MKALIYDIEIINAVPVNNEPPVYGVNYCEGWHDHANMGVSVIGCYDYHEDRYRVFCNEGFPEFKALAADRLCVGFNSIRFDNAVLRACGIADLAESNCYDILRELWIAAGVGDADPFDFKLHGGYWLDATCERNFGTKKTGNGALAPVLWQQGRYGEVIDYCLNDVKLTKQLFDRALSGEPIISPKDGGNLTLQMPPVGQPITTSAYPQQEETLTTGQPKITGYRNLSQDEIDLMNEAKALAEQCGAFIAKLRGFPATTDVPKMHHTTTPGAPPTLPSLDQRWISIGGTDLQRAFMAVIRGIAQPTTF